MSQYDKMFGHTYLQFLEMEEGEYWLTGYYSEAGDSYNMAKELLKKRQQIQ